MDRKNLIPYPAVVNFYQDNHTGEIIAIYHRQEISEDIHTIDGNIPDALRTLAKRIAENASNGHK